jgi:uncharacterized protein YqeY
MASLRERIQAELHEAMRAHDETRKSTLRMLTAAVHNADIDARSELDETGIQLVIQKQAKQRRESILEFQKASRQDLVAKEAAELAILEEYLPRQLSREDIEAAARKVIADTGASGPRDIGKVMPVLTKQLAGLADGRAINEVVRTLLGT